jgi:3',5'-cyclic AMP phosphodiesterase CpdA
MRIAHLSDLHFGRHNNLLKSNLAKRMLSLKPSLIVCTGDLSDKPDKKHLTEAYEYLDKLKEACISTNGPRIIVVPGNHDYRESGFLWLDRQRQYVVVFGADSPDYYFDAQENVWIFGFDSASNGDVGGGGYIPEKELERFHERYATLDAENPAFKDAFKIVALHHHPLPVNWDHKWRDRWLTLTNAGAFLSAVLFRRIDVVLHGHEHLQARSRLWSTLGDNDHELTIVSLGATLRQVDNPNRNWLGLIDIQPKGAHIEFYGSVGGATFSETPESRFEIRSRGQADDLVFEQSHRDAGYGYREVAALTVLDKDGDGRRRVEFEGLTIHSEECGRKTQHFLELPPTSGHLDCLAVTGATFDPTIPEGSRLQHHALTISFEQPLVVNEQYNYACSWYAVNAFAMDTRQFDFLHSREAKKLNDIEYTHLTVTDPIEELTVVVKFPEGFALPDRPRVRVAKPTLDQSSRGWESQPEIEMRLTRERALRYYDTLNIAAVRVRRPIQGLSYGIQWSLPKAPPIEIKDQALLDMRALRDVWKTKTMETMESESMTKLLARIVIAARKVILKGWDGPIDASFMYFDGEHELHLLSAVVDENQVAIEQQYKFSLRYGDGIAGRAFKSNQIRVYAALADEDSEQPDYYTRCTVGPPHKCLVSFPIRTLSVNETASTLREPYGVLSLGSTRSDCPLALAGVVGGPAPPSDLHTLNEAINRDLYSSFLSIFLHTKASGSGENP